MRLNLPEGFEHNNPSASFLLRFKRNEGPAEGLNDFFDFKNAYKKEHKLALNALPAVSATSRFESLDETSVQPSLVI